MGSGLEEDIGGSWHSGGGRSGGAQTPRILTLPRGLGSLTEAHDGKKSSVSCCPGLQDLRERAGAHLVASLWEGWGSPDSPIPTRVRGFNISERSGAPQKEEPKPNSLGGG